MSLDIQYLVLLIKRIEFFDTITPNNVQVLFFLRKNHGLTICLHY